LGPLTAEGATYLRWFPRSVLAPVESTISKWFCRHSSQDVCPWNERFALDEPAFAAREWLAGKDAETLAIPRAERRQGTAPRRAHGLASATARSSQRGGSFMPRKVAPPGPPSAPPQRDGPAEAASVSPPGAGDDAGLYRLLVASVSDYAIFAINPDGYVLSWNPGAARFKGYDAAEIIGKHFSVFYPPEDIAAGKPQRLLSLAAEHGHIEDEGWRLRKGGTRFWASVTLTALRNEAGTLVAFAKVTRDLTERRQAEMELRASEERFRLIVQSVRDYGIFLLDPRGYVASWNAGAQRITGYRAEEIVGHHFSEFYPAEEVAAGRPMGELEVAEHEGRYEEEGFRVRKDGSLYWASVIITALRNQEGELFGFAKVTRDLTDQRAAQQRAIADARRIAEVEASNRAKSEFLAAMSHELRTPLNAIGGYAELIDMGVAGTLTTQQREYVERIRGAQQHLLTLINDLLNYSRIEAGQLSYDMAPVRLHELVGKALALVHPQAARKKIQLKHGPCAEAILAWADRVKVEQIVLNLVSNAVKFTPEGGRVRATCAEQGKMAVVCIEDTGPGVPEDKREAIFEPFVQLGRTLTSVHEGAGLGLAISRDLARAMDGTVTHRPRRGGGSVFCLQLRRP